MASTPSLLPALLGIAQEETQLINLALAIASEGQIQYRGETFRFQLPDLPRRTSTFLAMAAGQSLGSILRLSSVKGIGARDMYAIARSAIETFVNATYLLCEAEKVSERALAHIPFAEWKHHNRVIGSGSVAFEIYTDGTGPEQAARLFPDFAAPGKSKNWSALDVPSRIARVAALAGKAPASRLNAAYGLTYALSSEIIHGSLYGVCHFYGVLRPGPVDLSNFMDRTERQIEELLIAVLHAAAGYLCAFFNLQSMTALAQAEEELFGRLIKVATSDETPGQVRKVHARSVGNRQNLK